jgi:hypothetical protein
LPPKVLEPYHRIKKIQRVISTAKPKGYRMCGDNIDMTVRRRFMRSDMKNESLHYFHSYAVQNRVDVSAQSDTVDPKEVPKPETIANTIIPCASDDKMLRELSYQEFSSLTSIFSSFLLTRWWTGIFSTSFLRKCPRSLQ